MSVVCAKVYDDYITIASDSGVYAGDSVVPGVSVEKILHVADDFIIGVCGDVSELNLMKWFARDHRPIENTEQGIFRFMGEFFGFCASERHSFPTEDPDEGDTVNEYLIVYGNKLYCCTGTLVNSVAEYAAIGAGSPYAMTALALGHDCIEAVRVASKLCVYVHTPVHWYNVFDPAKSRTGKSAFYGQV